MNTSCAASSASLSFFRIDIARLKIFPWYSRSSSSTAPGVPLRRLSRRASSSFHRSADMHDSFYDSDTRGEFPESPPGKQGVPCFFPEAQAHRPRARHRNTTPQNAWRNGSVRLKWEGREPMEDGFRGERYREKTLLDADRHDDRGDGDVSIRPPPSTGGRAGHPLRPPRGGGERGRVRALHRFLRFSPGTPSSQRARGSSSARKPGISR